jgi:hypothetical protein
MQINVFFLGGEISPFFNKEIGKMFFSNNRQNLNTKKKKSKQ